jgi:hypothetical protein
MATRMMRVCDVCEKQADDEAIRFGWGITFYETDLCADHGEELQSMMEKMVRHARRLGAPAKSVEVKSRSTKQTRPKVSTKEVRDWANKKGIEVSDRGRVPEALIAQFLEATRSS